MSVKIMVRYGELSTKGKNKKSFIHQLAHNVKLALKEFETVKVKANHDFMVLELNGAPETDVKEKLQYVFGIQSFALVYPVEKNFEAIGEQIVQLLSKMNTQNKTFKIAAKRSDHNFYMDTNELNRELGGIVLDNFPHLRVQVKNPDIQVRVEVRKESVYISTETIRGAGGLPVGTSGRGMMMLSGGIDSPVASYLAMKRGLELEMVHFYSPPYTSEQSLFKTQQLTQKLAKYSGSIQFIEVPFTKIQEAIKANCPEGYLMTITRRFMLRITDALREQRKGLVVLNGESMGQVASQTLHSMIAINEVTNTPIIRPVVAMDKLDIIDVAQQIDTFELSIQPFEDCCSVFAPPSPKTKPQLDKVLQYESRLPVAELVSEAVANVKIYAIDTSVSVTNEDSQMADLL